MKQFGRSALADIGKVAALTAWRLGRGVYVPDEAVADEAVSQLRACAGEGDDAWRSARLPTLTDFIAGLPDWCVYVAIPPRTQEVLRPSDDNILCQGVFVHLEHDVDTGRPELRLVLDKDGNWDRLLPVPIYLDRPNLGTAMADAGVNTIAGAQGVTGANLRSLGGPSVTAEFSGLAAWAALPLVLALLDPAVEIRDPDEPTAEPARARPRTDGRWCPAPSTRRWQITYRFQPTLKLVHSA